MPYSPMHKHCTPVKNLKGKTTGLMMEGSVAYQEETKKVEEAKAKKLDKKQEIQEKKDLLTEMPVDDKASAMEMSPYKMHNKEHLQKVGKDMPVHMDHDGVPMHGPLHEGHEDSPAKNANEGYGYEVPKPSVAKFTGMSGGSALHNTGARPATAKEKAEMRKKPAGANFFPPSNPKDKSSFKKPILDSNSPGYDVARPLYDSNKDGDTVFSDLNQDGTMLGRAVKKLLG